MSNRPFAVGDMVVCNKHGVGTVTDLNATYYKFVECKFGRKKIDFSLRGYETFYDERSTIDEHKTEFLLSEIITIRTPRKGGKEARDIVAMLAQRLQSHYYDVYDYWMDNAIDGDKKRAEKEYWSERKSGCFDAHDSFVCLQKAKSMLGVNNA